MYNLYCRLYQLIFKLASIFMPWRKPEVIEGENSVFKIAPLIKNKGISSVILVTDKVLISLGVVDPLLKSLSEDNIKFAVYDKTVQNPTIENVKEAFDFYNENKCEAIIAFGGGSPLDCAKALGALVARPNKSLQQLKGELKVRKQIPTLFAIPTTSGTGSEATVAAVISNSETHEKYAINDMSLIPHYAVLDPLLTIGLPANITSTTGMDALTHAVEAYIGNANTKETVQFSREAITLIFENLYEAYVNGQNIVARKNMQKASFLAGLAFTRAYIGYVHAIAHTLGGFYNLPHGLANAVILPHVLEYYGDACYKKLAELSMLIGVCKKDDAEEVKAKKFIEAIKQLNEKMLIPKNFDVIKDADIDLMVSRALREANPLYPVPKILNRKDLTKIYHIIK